MLILAKIAGNHLSLPNRRFLACFIAFVVVSTVLLGINVFPTRGATISLLGSTSSQAPQQTSYEIIQYPLPNGSTEPWSIATDSLGRPWFVEQGSNQLGMLNPVTGSITEYSVPTANSTVDSVAVDNSDNVWFTGLTSNQLGELKNGSSNIVEYEVPGVPYLVGNVTQFQSCGPTEAVPDSSGNIWVICEFSNQIDKFFPSSGKFLRFDLPIYQSAPAGLVFDNRGNFYFTAADADMLGHGVISELQNGTSNGITEFAPMNQTYTFTYQQAKGFFGPYGYNTSSLPTPSGIALSADGNTLWVTEHVDSSFDSYNIQSKSFVRYWTSKTNDAFGYSVSFPNGIKIDSSGNVWISEHYGNKIARFDPTADSLTEYIVPCCKSAIAGTYTLTLGQNGTVWFVEIGGNAIGELKPVPSGQTFAVSLGSTSLLNMSSSDTATVPVTVSMEGGSGPAENVGLSVSGISGTGELSGASASFSPGSLQFSSSGNATSQLTIKTSGLASGIYYLTVCATVSPQGVIYSQILKLTVSNFTNLLVYAVVIGSVASVAVVAFIAFRMGRRSRKLARRRRRR